MSDGNGVVIVLLIAYFFPALVAAMRRHNNQNAIAILNLLLGWTFLGWVIALVWAATNNVKPKASRSEQQETIQYSSVEEWEQAQNRFTIDEKKFLRDVTERAVISTRMLARHQ
jgi:Superinfection immunity protein